MASNGNFFESAEHEIESLLLQLRGSVEDAINTYASTSTTDRDQAKQLQSYIQANMAAMRARMRDMELLAEEQDTDEQAETLAIRLANHKQAYERLQNAYRAASLQVHKNTERKAIEDRKALLGSGGAPQRQLRLDTEADVVGAASNVTGSLQRTYNMLAEEFEHTNATLAAMGSSHETLRDVKGELTGQRARLKRSNQLLNKMKRHSWLDFFSLWGSVALFALVVLYIVTKRAAYFVPAGMLPSRAAVFGYLGLRDRSPGTTAIPGGPGPPLVQDPYTGYVPPAEGGPGGYPGGPPVGTGVPGLEEQVEAEGFHREPSVGSPYHQRPEQGNYGGMGAVQLDGGAHPGYDHYGMAGGMAVRGRPPGAGVGNGPEREEPRGSGARVPPEGTVEPEAQEIPPVSGAPSRAPATPVGLEVVPKGASLAPGESAEAQEAVQEPEGPGTPQASENARTAVGWDLPDADEAGLAEGAEIAKAGNASADGPPGGHAKRWGGVPGPELTPPDTDDSSAPSKAELERISAAAPGLAEEEVPALGKADTALGAQLGRAGEELEPRGPETGYGAAVEDRPPSSGRPAVDAAGQVDEGARPEPTGGADERYSTGERGQGVVADEAGRVGECSVEDRAAGTCGVEAGGVGEGSVEEAEPGLQAAPGTRHGLETEPSEGGTDIVGGTGWETPAGDEGNEPRGAELAGPVEKVARGAVDEEGAAGEGTTLEVEEEGSPDGATRGSAGGEEKGPATQQSVVLDTSLAAGGETLGGGEPSAADKGVPVPEAGLEETDVERLGIETGTGNVSEPGTVSTLLEGGSASPEGEPDLGGLELETPQGAILTGGSLPEPSGLVDVGPKGTEAEAGSPNGTLSSHRNVAVERPASSQAWAVHGKHGGLRRCGRCWRECRGKGRGRCWWRWERRAW
eukprot:jgi/Botrbrau1/8659/Bobra.0087s0013.1